MSGFMLGADAQSLSAVPAPYAFEVTLFEPGAFRARAVNGALVTGSARGNVRRVALEWRHLTGAELTAMLTSAGGAFVLSYPDPYAGQTRQAVFAALERSVRVSREGGNELTLKAEEV